MAHISYIWRYPLKGAHGKQLAKCDISDKIGLAGDRRFAIKKEARHPNKWLAKAAFHVAMNTPLMAKESPQFFESESGHKILTPEYLSGLQNRLGATEPLAVLDTEGAYGMTDTDPHKYGPTVSILNLETVKVLRESLRIPIDPRRFRMNVWVRDLPAFAELDWVPTYPGTKSIEMGSVRFRVDDACERCLAINANPLTGERDMELDTSLSDFMKSRGYVSPHRGKHCVMGVLAVPLSSGTLTVGDPVVVT